MTDPHRSTDASSPAWPTPPTSKERNAVQRSVDRLLDALAPERSLKGADRGAVPVEAHRTPNGCVLQGASAALSVSWFAEASDSTTLGELQITVWSGVVSRRGAVRPRENAAVVRELALRPVERPVDQCVWRATDGTLYDGDALATHCLHMLEQQMDPATQPAS